MDAKGSRERIEVGGSMDPLAAVNSSPTEASEDADVDPEALERDLADTTAEDVDAGVDDDKDSGLDAGDTAVSSTEQAFDESRKWATRMQELGLSRLAQEKLAVDLHETKCYLLARSTGDAVLGKVVITWYQVIFVPDAEDAQRVQHIPEMQLPPETFAIPLGAIDRLEILRRTNRTGYQEVQIIGKAVHSIRLQVPDNAEGNMLVENLHKLTFPQFKPVSLFAFEHKVPLVAYDGIDVCDMHALDYSMEWARQGVLDPWDGNVPCPWRISIANGNYELCASYPPSLVVPTSVSDNELGAVASFRSERRIPALTWGRAGDAGSIWRCSQPKVGASNTCSQDERTLAALGNAVITAALARQSAATKGENMRKWRTAGSAAGSAAGSSAGSAGGPSSRSVAGSNGNARGALRPTRKTAAGVPSFNEAGGSRPVMSVIRPFSGMEIRPILHIVDCRPKAAALANRATGYGYELNANYPCCNLKFYNISNIHAMRDSFTRIRTEVERAGVGYADEYNFTNVLNESRWLNYIALILDTAYTVAQVVHFKREPVLVHCSHGWDRTSQVCSIAQLLLDPYYRTLDGFAVLIEKDWCGFGHPFSLRTAHGVHPNERVHDGTQCSPIFLQWLDTVHQLVSLFPTHFEFNVRLLLFLADALYSCRWGTFLCDNEKQRVDFGIRSGATNSVWAFVRANRYAFTSPTYVKPPERVLWRGVESKDVVFEDHETIKPGWAGVLLPSRASIMCGLRFWADFFCRFSPRLVLPHRNLQYDLAQFRERLLLTPRALLEEIAELRRLLRSHDGVETRSDEMLESLFRRAAYPDEKAAPRMRKWRMLHVGGTMDLVRCEEADLALGHLYCVNDIFEMRLRLQELYYLQRLAETLAALKSDVPIAKAEIVEAHIESNGTAKAEEVRQAGSPDAGDGPGAEEDVAAVENGADSENAKESEGDGAKTEESSA
mmetsp:Transcript_1233/g.5226  ORF Transcript_1233/g.5226 Transcript_1233/m.5226 type:complete len:950 (-) Transcript_1233:543-3392(-)|eukprot:scaffold1954_cov268-Pinguiococcus_pyrenoidosus.AAC.248